MTTSGGCRTTIDDDCFALWNHSQRWVDLCGRGADLCCRMAQVSHVLKVLQLMSLASFSWPPPLYSVVLVAFGQDKLVSVGKSKRKRLESTFEEQQEKLRILHDKFKEEVNRQLLGCRNSLEDFEAYHAKLKGVADKQKVSHKKLLLNAEKTVGSELNDAETKIADVQKSARNRMNGLKYVLKELIAETAD